MKEVLQSICYPVSKVRSLSMVSKCLRPASKVARQVRTYIIVSILHQKRYPFSFSVCAACQLSQTTLGFPDILEQFAVGEPPARDAMNHSCIVGVMARNCLEDGKFRQC